MRIAVIGATGQVGLRLVDAAEAAGTEVVGISRASGFELTQPAPAGPDPLARALAGCDALIDVLQCPDLQEHAASRFFVNTTQRLAQAADEAGVPRRVLLSIIGVDQAAGPGTDPAPATTEGYYRAKYRQEQAFAQTKATACVLRSAQFHDFTPQMLGRYGEAVVAKVLDMPVQSVELSLVIETLLDLAVGRRTQPLLEVAGPRPERLVELARYFSDAYFDDLRVEPVQAGRALAGGLLLPGPEALLGGRTFQDWLTPGKGGGAQR